MSDLSKVLGDLYEAPEPTAAPAPAGQNRFEASVPDWANDDRLDQAFSGWTPGPPADAPAAEREMSVVVDTPYVPAARLDHDLSASLSEALIDAGAENHDPDVPVASAPAYELPGFDDEPMPLTTYETAEPVATAPVAVPAYEPAYEPASEPAVVESYAPEPARPWTRGSDDILPGKHGHSITTAKAKKAKGEKIKGGEATAPEAPPAGPKKKLFGLQLRK